LLFYSGFELRFEIVNLALVDRSCILTTSPLLADLSKFCT
jgi:hypothetical protein